MNKIKFSQFFQGLMGVVLIMGIIGCTPQVAVETETPTETPFVTQTLAETEPPHVSSPTEASPTVLLVVGDGTDPFIAENIQKTVGGLVSEGGLVLQTLESLTPEMLSPNVEIVVGVGPNLDLGNLAVVAPETAFVAVDNPNASLADNLSIIGDPTVEQEHQSFMAGYLTALISADYKVGTLVPADVEDSELILDAFVTGARFFCGICQPKYPPYNAFPQWETLSPANAVSGFQPAVDRLINLGVEVVYVPEPLLSSELLSYLAEVGLKVVGDSEPELKANNWVGTLAIDPSPALIALWPELLMGPIKVRVPGSITLIDTEAGLISEGRYRLFEEMLTDLQAGLVSPRPIQ